MTRRRLIGPMLMAAAVTAGAAACTSGSESAGESTADPAEATEVTAPATVPPTAPSTTTLPPPTTTSPPTTTTTLAPTTTVDPIAELEAAIERDLNLGEQALLVAAADPSDEALRRELERFYGGTALDRVVTILDGLEESGLRARPNPDVSSELKVFSLTDLPEGAGSTSVVTRLCRIDAGVVYEPLPDGGEIVVDDGIRVVVSLSPVALINGTWALQGGDLVETLSQESRCENA